MAKFEKFSPEKQLRGLAEAARRIQAEEREGTSFPFGANAPSNPTDIVVEKLRQMRQPVTNESYSELAFWKPFRKLTAEEKCEVREAVYKANIH